MMKKVFAWLAALLLLGSPALAENEIHSKESLNAQGRRIGISQGTAAESAILSELPEATIEYFTDYLLGCTAVAQGKLDAYIYDRIQMQLAIDQGLTGVRLLPEDMDETVKIGVGVSDVSGIPDLMGKINRFIAEMKADGTLDDMYRRWVLERNSVMPEIPAPENPGIHLTVGTTGSVPPYSYYEDGGLTGYDIELAYRFAAWLGADVSFQIFDFGGIISAAKSGKVDVIMSNLQYLPERAEELPYSDILYEEKMGIMVREAAPEEKAVQETLQAYDGKQIGVQTGSTFDRFVTEQLPHAQISYFKTYTDLASALLAGKIDGFPGDEPVIALMASENPRITWIKEYMDTFDFGYMLPKTEQGERLLSQINEYLESIRASGELEELTRKWTEGPEEGKTVPDYASFPAPNGVLTFATEGEYPPMDYVRNGEPVGLETDLTARFCERYGYGLKVELISYDGIQPSVMTGKVDLAAAGFAITPERAESIHFSNSYYTGGTVMAVLKAEDAGAAAVPQEESFGDSITSSFNKTFIREGRWKLFLEGIGTTMLITVLSILSGTALGFLLFMLCRNGNIAANGITRFCMWLIQGTPMVVLLMILYYIIFGSVAISGIAVAVIGFTLTFGAAVFGMLKMGVGTIDRGQYEAAYALGHTNRHTFFRIILPQAVPHVLPAYQGEIVGLIKATAIVGYIAVQDLTKMGDIVRSRTYEAFFPLIAITVIYFAMEGLFSLTVSRIRVSMDPKKRRPDRILKGVNIHDQD